MRGVLEDAVAVAVTNDIRRAILANRQRGRSPQIAGIEVLNIKPLAGPVADRVVRPLRKLMLLAVDCPGVARALDRDLEAERLIRDHVDPRRRRPLSLAENRHVLASIGGEPAESVEELEIAPRQQNIRWTSRAPSRRRRTCRRLERFQP